MAVGLVRTIPVEGRKPEEHDGLKDGDRQAAVQNNFVEAMSWISLLDERKIAPNEANDKKVNESEPELEVKDIEKLEAEAEAAALDTLDTSDPTPTPVQRPWASARSRSMMNRNALANPGASLYVPVRSYTD
jgi:hypothetical protein